MNLLNKVDKDYTILCLLLVIITVIILLPIILMKGLINNEDFQSSLK